MDAGFWTRRTLSIVLIGVFATAAVSAAVVTVLEQHFPAGPQPAVPIVHLTSPCSPLIQGPIVGSGVFTNATGTFITNGTAVAIRYWCTTADHYFPAVNVTQEDPVALAPATPTITGLTSGTLYLYRTNSGYYPYCDTSNSDHGVSLSSGLVITAASGNYDYCVVIQSYTTQVQFTVSWAT